MRRGGEDGNCNNNEDIPLLKQVASRAGVGLCAIITLVRTTAAMTTAAMVEGRGDRLRGRNGQLN
jgi:hypothetical protein